MKIHKPWNLFLLIGWVVCMTAPAWAGAQFTEKGRQRFFDRFEANCVVQEKTLETPRADDIAAFCSCVRQRLSKEMTQEEIMGMIHGGGQQESVGEKRAAAEKACQ
ncbi:hypothetical protein [Desulfovibrio inopinatus]|uniref:hypothetical protein n=1 Tax=Desulfovibrio inopinatus TaxID=102109 RepID=UPI0003FE9429|nr:hypothetical protein [Desulfovibrio inopinatus]